MPPKIRVTVKAKAIAKPKAKVPSMDDLHWIETGTSCYFLEPKREWSHRLALFDLDNTLLSTGGLDPIDEGIDMLRKYINRGWTVAVLSNQHGICKGHTTHEEVRARFRLLSKLCPGPIIFMYSTAKDQYRKPMIGMYKMLLELTHLDQHAPESFYCGDAAGRAKDFAISDRYFAHNCGLKFLPASPFTATSAIAKKYNMYADSEKWQTVHQLTIENLDLSSSKKVLVMMVGPPGAGKSTLSMILSQRYPDMIALNRDTIGDTRKMTRMYADAIRSGKSIILDNLNTNGDKRNEYLSGLTDEYVVICYHFNIPKELSTHLCNMRVCQGGKYIPPVVRHTYYKHHVKPTGAEPGIDKVITITGFPLLDGQKPPDEFYMYYNLKER